MDEETPDAIELHPQDNSADVDKVALKSDGEEKPAEEPKPVEEEPKTPEPAEEEPAEEEPEEPEEKVEIPEEYQQYGEFGKYAQELGESGDISEESITELKEKYHLPEAIIKEYIDNAKELSTARTEKAAAESEAFVKAIHESVGGADRYEAITDWARKNLDAEEIDIFNNMVQGKKAEAKLAIEGLKARFEAVHGPAQPELVQGKAVAKTESGYQNMDEYIADLSDPRSKFDKAYMAAVNRKLERSDLKKLR